MACRNCLFKLIKTMNNNDTLSLYIEADDSNRLGIKIENGEKNTLTTYYLNLIEFFCLLLAIITSKLSIFLSKSID